MKQTRDNQDNIQQEKLENNIQKKLEAKGITLFIQFLKFGLVGISNTLVSGVIYFLMNCKLGYQCIKRIFMAKYICI